MNDFEVIWKELIVDLLNAAPANRREMQSQELLNVSRSWEYRTAMLGNRVRDISVPFAKAEALLILEGRNDVSSLTKHAPSIGRFSDNGAVFTGAYGPHWIAQRQYIIDTLTRDLYSRQAVLTIWQPRPSASSDIPCTISWQFMMVDGRLDMFVNMRSSDIWLGLPYDAFTWSVILRHMALTLGVDGGKVHYHASTLHLYARNRPNADAVAKSAARNHRWLPFVKDNEALLDWLR